MHPSLSAATRLGLGLATGAMLLVACQQSAGVPVGAGGKAAISVPANPAAAARLVTIEASDYAFSTPEAIAGGLVTLRLVNGGHETHHAQLLRLKDGVTLDQLFGAFQSEGEAALRFITAEGGVGAIDPGGAAEVTVNLTPGQYVLACFLPSPDGTPHLVKGMVKPLKVTAEESGAAAPVAHGTVTLKDFAFEVPVFHGGRGTYRIVNQGQQIHEFVVVRLAPGKTADDAARFFSAPAGPPPFQSVGGMNGLDPGRSGYATLDLTPGDYAAICLVPDPASGTPHVHLGMVKAFTVR
jgi:uncharacterized cupredoxin-like copper-binding protein